MRSTPRDLVPALVGATGFDIDRPHLSVDGMTPRGPNLSHWPGNRTPTRFKADLSTGICLNFARAPLAERAELLGDAECVTNDHYDTDGFLSMLAVLRPEVALAHEELCLAAAATGDFQAYQSKHGFAVDRIVANIASSTSPVADTFGGVTGADKALARYVWLLGNAERVLGDPDSLAGCWLDEWRACVDELDACRSGAMERERMAHAGLSIARTPTPVRRMTLNTLAGAFRILHVITGADGPRYRYHDRTESWFEVVSFTPMPRVDLRPLAARLQELEGPPDGRFRWCADPPTEPVPELWFGVDESQAYGLVSRTLGPSRLPPESVRAALLTHLCDRPEASGP